jgi:hypothetical protein
MAGVMPHTNLPHVERVGLAKETTQHRRGFPRGEIEAAAMDIIPTTTRRLGQYKRYYPVPRREATVRLCMATQVA